MAKTTRWDGGHASSNNFSEADNWDNGVPVAGDTLEFGGTTRLTPNNDIAADTSFAAITFVSGAGAFTIGGNRITLGGTLTNDDDSTQTISLNIILDSTRTINCASGDITLSGTISGGGLTKAGTGILSLGSVNANQWSGVTTVSAGTLQLLSTQNTDNYRSTSWTISSGATLKNGAKNTIINTAIITVNSGGTWDMNGLSEVIAYIAGGGNIIMSGALTL